jgi:hypothetical protein
MRVLVIVISHHLEIRFASVIEAKEQALVEKLVPHATIETFHEAVLHGLARLDEAPVDRSSLRPGKHRVRCEVGTLIRHNHFGLAATFDERRQFSGHSTPGNRGIWNRRQTFTRGIINNIEDAKPRPQANWS